MGKWFCVQSLWENLKSRANGENKRCLRRDAYLRMGEQNSWKLGEQFPLCVEMKLHKMYLAQFHGSAYHQMLRLQSQFPAYVQAPNFCASLVSVECLVMWSMHTQKPKFAANSWNTPGLKHKIPCFRKCRFCSYGKQSREIGIYRLHLFTYI